MQPTEQDMDVMAKLAVRLDRVRASIAQACRAAQRSTAGILVVAVTKSATDAQVVAIARLGVRDLAENRSQQIAARIALVAGMDVRWHMIGRIQTNKVREIVRNCEVVHSADTFRVAEAIEREARNTDRRVGVLLQVNVSGEASKAGVTPMAASYVAEEITRMTRVDLLGLMTMAPLTDDMSLVRRVFSGTRELLEQLRKRGCVPANCTQLSMGMSGDYPVAVEEGATMVRLGSAIFGERASADGTEPPAKQIGG